MPLLARLATALPQAVQPWLLQSHARSGLATAADSEGLLEAEKDYDAQPIFERWRVTKPIRVRRYVAFIAVSTILSLLLTAAFRSRSRSQARLDQTRHQNSQTLHLLIPTTDYGPELCKTVLSAEVLHYSTPTLVQWDAVANDAFANTQRRTTAMRDHLGKLREQHENDTVVLLGSSSTLFQLRPEVLLKRYYDINRRGNQQLMAGIGIEAMEEEGIEQSVVFSASSTCGSAKGSASGCPHVPASPLTAKVSRMSAPRYLEQGMVIGPVKDVHEIYRRTVAMIERADTVVDELAILSEIFSNQEHHRALLGPKTRSWSERFQGLFSGSYAHGPLARKNATTHPTVNDNDFGIGLDYAGELSSTTALGPESFAWTRHGSVPQDIVASMPPFWTTTGQGLPTENAWSDLKLFTNAYTHTIPAAIYHNTTEEISVRGKQWERLWLRQHSRKLFDAYTAVPAMPLAAVVDNESVEQVFWSTTIGEKAGVKSADGRWHGWKEIFQGDELANEIFGDQLGEWKSPML